MFKPYCGKADVKQIIVPADLTDFSVPWPEYDAQVQSYTNAEYLRKDGETPARPAWGDNPDVAMVQAKLLHKQTVSTFTFNAQGYPLCPLGRRGILGRGRLGEYGPQYAVDPVLTYNVRDAYGKDVINKLGDPVLMLHVITRRNGERALAGGLKDKVVNKKSNTMKPEHVFACNAMMPAEQKEDGIVAVAREFAEEALGQAVTYGESKVDASNELQQLFREQSEILYQGIVKREDRNTDWAWMETEVYWVHDLTGVRFAMFPLKPGQSELTSEWIVYNTVAKPLLFADHNDYVDMAITRLKARKQDGLL
jgi:hypothetical protein